MKFFVPLAKDPESALEVYSIAKSNLETQRNTTISDRKIYSLTYTYKSKQYSAVVGEQDPIEGEVVVAIFFEPSRNLYHICTPHRGLIEGLPKLVGASDLQKFVDFE